MQDASAIRIFLDFCKWFKPDIRIHGGDAFDLRALRKSASEDEKRESIGVDIECGLEFMRRFEPHIFLRGNHDERLWDAAKNFAQPLLKDYAADKLLEIGRTLRNVNVLPYNKRYGVYPLGHLNVIHGYGSGVTAARTHAIAYASNILMGHIHADDVFSMPGLERRRGWSSGCLCRLDMDYNRMQLGTLRQCHGFAYGLLFPDKSFKIWTADNDCGRWVFASEVKICE